MPALNDDHILSEEGKIGCVTPREMGALRWMIMEVTSSNAPIINNGAGIALGTALALTVPVSLSLAAVGALVGFASGKLMATSVTEKVKKEVMSANRCVSQSGGLDAPEQYLP